MDGRVGGCLQMDAYWTQGGWGSENFNIFADVIYLRSLRSKVFFRNEKRLHYNFSYKWLIYAVDESTKHLLTKMKYFLGTSEILLSQKAPMSYTI